MQHPSINKFEKRERWQAQRTLYMEPLDFDIVEPVLLPAVVECLYNSQQRPQVLRL